MTDALVLRDVTKRYRTVAAVDGLSLSVAHQEIFALLGPNGAGKTTTVRMVQGILPPDEGEIVFGVDGARGVCRPGLGYLPEERGLYRDQPVERILQVFGRMRGLSRAEAKERAAHWLDRFGLLDRRREKLEALSKGNQQKVQFAAAILHGPRLAVLDEPFSGLDPVNQDLFLDLLEELRRGGMTIVLSAHQMDLVERCADRLLIMGGGRRLLEGTPDDLRAQGGTGARLVVTLEGPSPATTGDGPVASVEAAGDDAFTVTGADGVTLGALMAAVSGWPGLVEVTSARRRLHEVYVDAVAGAGHAPADLAAAAGASTHDAAHAGDAHADDGGVTRDGGAT